MCVFPTGGYTTNYALEVKERLMNWDSVLRLTGDSSFLSHKLPDLTPLTNYEARVLSINFNGPSDFSAIREFSTVGEYGISLIIRRDRLKCSVSRGM